MPAPHVHGTEILAPVKALEDQGKVFLGKPPPGLEKMNRISSGERLAKILTFHPAEYIARRSEGGW